MPVSLRCALGERREEAMVSVTIDKQTLDVEAGSTVLQAAQRLGIDIPTFCYLKRLPALASCRMCLVEIEGLRRLLVTPAYHRVHHSALRSQTDSNYAGLFPLFDRNLRATHLSAHLTGTEIGLSLITR